jgi:hypothetical protein
MTLPVTPMDNPVKELTEAQEVEEKVFTPKTTRNVKIFQSSISIKEKPQMPT